MRKRLFRLHSYFALAALIPLMIVSLTGSILVFKTEIDQWLMPSVAGLSYTREEQHSLTRIDHDALNETVEATFDNYVIGGWEIFYDGQEADRVYIVEKNTDDWYKVYFDPFSNTILSDPIKLESLFTDWLLVLHYSFMLNGLASEHSQIGTLTGFIASIILIFLAVSGLIIYKKFWLNLFKLRIRQKPRVVSGDAHRLIGIWSAPLILILGITGCYFNLVGLYHEWVEHPTEEHFMPAEKLYSQHLSIQGFLDDSISVLSNFTPTFIRYPTEPDRDFTIFGFQPTLNVFSSNYASTVSYKKQNGERINTNDGREAAIGIQILDSFRELHFGSFGGLLSKLLYAILGLAPFLLGVTGCVIWALRKKKKRKTISMSPDPQTVQSGSTA